MPNDCLNFLTISGVTHDQWNTLANSLQSSQTGSQHNFLKTFCPEPTWQSIPNENGDLPQAPNRFGISFFPDGQEDDRGYCWRLKHWGTKWDAYYCSNEWQEEESSSDFQANFCTAWLPLNENCMASLSKHFPGALLSNYYEDQNEDFCGTTIAKDGAAKDICMTMSKFRESFLREHFPDLDSRLEELELDPKEDLDEFFSDYCDPCDFSEFVRNFFSIAEILKFIDSEEIENEAAS